jgi:hypothetical protein
MGWQRKDFLLERGGGSEVESVKGWRKGKEREEWKGDGEAEERFPLEKGRGTELEGEKGWREGKQRKEEKEKNGWGGSSKIIGKNYSIFLLTNGAINVSIS